jgi:maltose alpha-D-glucosyltransferase/alpha-amylase
VEKSRGKMAERLRHELEHDILAKCVVEQRWFAAKGEELDNFALVQAAEWPAEKENWLLAWLEVCCHEGERQLYFLPLAIAWEDHGEERLRELMPKALARVRQRSRIGILYDAMADAAFVNRLIRGMADEELFPFNDGRLQFMHTSAFAELTRDYQPGPLELPPTEGSNSTLILGDKLFIKAYRHLQQGINPEMEIGRFLTDASPYPNIVPLAGALQYHGPGETTVTLALLQGFVDNQGDAWSYTVDYLERFFEDALHSDLINAGAVDESLHSGYLVQLETLGRRTGELHQALARPTGDPAFEPEPITGADLTAWRKVVSQELRQNLKKLQRALSHLSDELREDAEHLLVGKERLLEWCETRLPAAIQANKTRYHGDYHMGQVLLVKNDFIIIDFEGEPARPLANRRIKHSPLRDVAGMLRSFNYAAEYALSQSTAERPLDLPQLRPLAESWEEATREAFLSGYRATIKGCSSYPADESHAEALIALFTLEKALYELRYELQNRPDWLNVPVKGLLAFLQTVSESDDA